MEQLKEKNLKLLANNVRRGIIEGVYNAGSGHPGGSLSIADVITYLYFEEMNIDPKNPKMVTSSTLRFKTLVKAPSLQRQAT